MKEKTNMTFGEKIKFARKSAGLTQEQLADKLLVSRQAITKWESNRGMPDIENLRQLSKLLDVSIEYLLDDGEHMDLSVMKEGIDLDAYPYDRKFSRRWSKKTGKKDMIVRDKFPHAEIHALVGKQILTHGEKVTDKVLGWVFDAPFGIPQFINGLKNTDKEFYLVNDVDKQYFVIVTDEFIESRKLANKITEKKFVIGNFQFIVGCIIPEHKN